MGQCEVDVTSRLSAELSKLARSVHHIVRTQLAGEISNSGTGYFLNWVGRAHHHCRHYISVRGSMPVFIAQSG
jgi:hypothetical protein